MTAGKLILPAVISIHPADCTCTVSVLASSRFCLLHPGVRSFTHHNPAAESLLTAPVCSWTVSMLRMIYRQAYTYLLACSILASPTELQSRCMAIYGKVAFHA